MSAGQRVPYRIVVRGELSDRLSAGFEGLRLERANGTTALVGNVVDQAHLQGVLDQIQNLGLEVVSVNPEEPATH